ncbi:MAG: GAF domain-containing protein [Desulfohalobiaceae bacterium]
MSKEQDYYHSLYQVAKVINSSLEPAQVLETIAGQVVQSMDLQACSLRLLDSGGQRLLMGASQGLSQGYLRKGAVEVAKSRLDQEALEGKKPVQVQDARTDSRFQYPEKAREEGLISLIVLPLMVEDRAIGVIRAYSGQEREFTAGEIEFLSIIANLSAIALENARLHQRLKLDCQLQADYDYRLFED